VHVQDGLSSIAALASLVSAAIAQALEHGPAWRKSALALVPAGYAGGDAYRPDELQLSQSFRFAGDRSVHDQICIGRP
jgi:hypothetical protein